MRDGRRNFIDTIVNIVNEGKASIDEKKQTISFKSRHWDESRDRIMASSPQGALFLFNSPHTIRGLYNKVSARLN